MKSNDVPYVRHVNFTALKIIRKDVWINCRVFLALLFPNVDFANQSFNTTRGT